MPKVWNKKTEAPPSDAVYVGRPTKYGNPFHVPPTHQGRNTEEGWLFHNQAVGRYRKYLTRYPGLIEAVQRELGGKDLVCWCAPLPCHADILLEVANAGVDDTPAVSGG